MVYLTYIAISIQCTCSVSRSVPFSSWYVTAVSTLTQVVQTICANNVGSCILLSLYVQDIVLSVVIVVGLTGAGILPVYVAVRWTDVVLSDNLPELRDIRNCLAATAVSCNNPTLYNPTI